VKTWQFVVAGCFQSKLNEMRHVFLTKERAFIVKVHPRLVFPFPLPTNSDGPEGSLEDGSERKGSEASEAADLPESSSDGGFQIKKLPVQQWFRKWTASGKEVISCCWSRAQPNGQNGQLRSLRQPA
jgi:hypothetical protein